MSVISQAYLYESPSPTVTVLFIYSNRIILFIYLFILLGLCAILAIHCMTTKTIVICISQLLNVAHLVTTVCFYGGQNDKFVNL